jgi:hypothetical protein
MNAEKRSMGYYKKEFTNLRALVMHSKKEMSKVDLIGEHASIIKCHRVILDRIVDLDFEMDRIKFTSASVPFLDGERIIKCQFETEHNFFKEEISVISNLIEKVSKALKHTSNADHDIHMGKFASSFKASISS